MYITISSIKKSLGKYIEMNDLYIGLPILFLFLTLFSFDTTRMIALIILTIGVFLMLPITVSKKNRMYKQLAKIRTQRTYNSIRSRTYYIRKYR